MSAEEERETYDRQILLDMGKCASKSQNGFLCTQTANHFGRRHKAQVFGGVDDGKTMEEWDW